MSALVSILRKEIEQTGVMPFARFMELALYSPDHGYYEQIDVVGAKGDFYTSVSVGSLFGELLAYQFADWFREFGWKSGGTPPSLQIIEAGAHDGRLAADVLGWFQAHCPEIFPAMEYWIVEPSAAHTRWQAARLKEFSNVKWVTELSALSGNEAPAYRIIFSNELLDAMPVHRLGWDAKAQTWFEWGVDWCDELFVWRKLPVSSPARQFRPAVSAELAEVLFDEFVTEISPAAAQWWRNAAKAIGKGKILALDYGLSAEEFLVPERSLGTLRAYFQHHAISDLLARPGEQDLTAHVNFTALEKAGEAAELKTDMLTSQARFLTGIAGRTWKNPDRFGEWDATRRRQFQTLTHPEHLGRPFKVLVQTRGL